MVLGIIASCAIRIADVGLSETRQIFLESDESPPTFGARQCLHSFNQFKDAACSMPLEKEYNSLHTSKLLQWSTAGSASAAM